MGCHGSAQHACRQHSWVQLISNSKQSASILVCLCTSPELSDDGAHLTGAPCGPSAGAVGLEALSRGCEQCHFIEMDPSVANTCLDRNISSCNLSSQAVVHTSVSVLPLA